MLYVSESMCVVVVVVVFKMFVFELMLTKRMWNVQINVNEKLFRGCFCWPCSTW